ncbi:MULTISPECIES: hypothetical protein [unclassified Leptolyngbya]|nr:MULTISPECIES: hypothetical protein [unclassified Leptolyngbya]
MALVTLALEAVAERMLAKEDVFLNKGFPNGIIGYLPKLKAFML